MDWILIANHEHTNPGDVFIRLGIERLIRHADPHAKFQILQRDYGDELANPIPFDRSVLCGMAFVYSHYLETPTGIVLSNTTNHGWWGPLTGWLSADRKMIISGFGVAISPGNPWQMVQPDYTIAKIKRELFSRCRSVYCRQTYGANLFDVAGLYCPAVFSGMDLPLQPKTLKLFNGCHKGGHWPWLSPSEHQIWKNNMIALTKMAQEHGFEFIAHNESEKQYALEVGWPKAKVIDYYDDPQRMLKTYSCCHRYLGNRIHGAIVSRSFGAQVRCINYDSRLEAIRLVGGEALFPSEMIQIPPAAWIEWMTSEQPGQSLDLEAAFQVQREIFQR